MQSGRCPVPLVNEGDEDAGSILREIIIFLHIHFLRPGNTGFEKAVHVWNGLKWM